MTDGRQEMAEKLTGPLGLFVQRKHNDDDETYITRFSRQAELRRLDPSTEIELSRYTEASSESSELYITQFARQAELVRLDPSTEVELDRYVEESSEDDSTTSDETDIEACSTSEMCSSARGITLGGGSDADSESGSATFFDAEEHQITREYRSARSVYNAAKRNNLPIKEEMEKYVAELVLNTASSKIAAPQSTNTLPVKHPSTQVKEDNVTGLPVPTALPVSEALAVPTASSVPTALRNTSETPNAQPDEPAVMPRVVRDALTKYKHASRSFARQLYDAASPHCSMSQYASKRWERYDEDETPYVYFVITPPESYMNLANILINKAPQSITWEMLREVRTEFKWRRLVDDWHKSLPETDSRRKELEGHQLFTKKISVTGHTLFRKFLSAHPEFKDHGFAVDNEADQARRSIGL